MVQHLYFYRPISTVGGEENFPALKANSVVLEIRNLRSKYKTHIPQTYHVLCIWCDICTFGSYVMYCSSLIRERNSHIVNLPPCFGLIGRFHQKAKNCLENELLLLFLEETPPRKAMCGCQALLLHS